MQPATGWTGKWVKAGFKDLGPDLGGIPVHPSLVLAAGGRVVVRARRGRAGGGSTEGRAGGISVGCAVVGGAQELLKAL